LEFPQLRTGSLEIAFGAGIQNVTSTFLNPTRNEIIQRRSRAPMRNVHHIRTTASDLKSFPYEVI
jgi:uncharacterized protein YcbK (DUF882 family)